MKSGGARGARAPERGVGPRRRAVAERLPAGHGRPPPPAALLGALPFLGVSQRERERPGLRRASWPAGTSRSRGSRQSCARPARLPGAGSTRTWTCRPRSVSACCRSSPRGSSAKSTGFSSAPRPRVAWPLSAAACRGSRRRRRARGRARGRGIVRFNSAARQDRRRRRVERWPCVRLSRHLPFLKALQQSAAFPCMAERSGWAGRFAEPWGMGPGSGVR